MKLSSFRHDDWTKIWAGNWSLLSCSDFSDQYTKKIIFGGRPFESQSIIFYKKGQSAGWMRQSDRDRLGFFLADEVAKNKERVCEICATLKKRSDKLLSFIAQHMADDISEKIYKEFLDLLVAYYTPHINVKYIVDYLEPALLEEFLPVLQEARLHVESVLDKTEDFMAATALKVSGQIGIPQELVLCLTQKELSEYFAHKTIVPKEILEERNEGAVILADKESSVVFSGRQVKAVEEIVYAGRGESIKGSVAYKGKVQGRVRVIHNPAGAKFEEGEILVTGMTRPDYLSIITKAAAFVTDAGGVLSHAAITARELKKPCIIGAQIATQVLRDGDLVEVDADNGMVKILKRAKSA